MDRRFTQKRGEQKRCKGIKIILLATFNQKNPQKTKQLQSDIAVGDGEKWPHSSDSPPPTASGGASLSNDSDGSTRARLPRLLHILQAAPPAASLW